MHFHTSPARQHGQQNYVSYDNQSIVMQVGTGVVDVKGEVGCWGGVMCDRDAVLLQLFLQVGNYLINHCDFADKKSGPSIMEFIFRTCIVHDIRLVNISHNSTVESIMRLRI